MLQDIKKSLSTITLIALVLSSLFVLCYLPGMQMGLTHKPASQSSHLAKGSEQCCESQNNSHVLTAIGIPASTVNLEGLFLLLGLSLLSLFGRDFRQAVKNFTNFKLLYARQFIARLFNYLIQLFSRGVLHPKLYSA